MHVRLHLRTGTVLVLLVKRGKSRTWLAARVGVTRTKMTRMLNGTAEVPEGLPPRIQQALGPRNATWDDLFRMELVGSDTAT